MHPNVNLVVLVYDQDRYGHTVAYIYNKGVFIQVNFNVSKGNIGFQNG